MITLDEAIQKFRRDDFTELTMEECEFVSWCLAELKIRQEVYTKYLKLDEELKRYKKAFELTLEDLEHTVNVFDIALAELNSNKSHIELMREYYLDKAKKLEEGIK